MSRLPLAALVVVGLGCATGAPVGGRAALLANRVRPIVPPAQPRELPPEPLQPESAELAFEDVKPGARAKVLELARSLVGKSAIVLGGRRYQNDCTGLVKGVFAQVGLELGKGGEPGDNGVTALWRDAQRLGRVYPGGWPVPGDLVFFNETYDLNRDGRVNDGLTHIGLVDAVEADGTITVIHRVARGVVRYRMNLLHRDRHEDRRSGKVLNDYLRAAGPSGSEVLTGQLFAGFATLLPVDGRIARR